MSTIAPTTTTVATLLVVEDDDGIRELLGDALRFAGFRVDTATRGFTALDAVRTARPDLLILDVNLPDIDGFEVCRRLRAAGDPVPIIFLTARSSIDDLRAGFAGGGDDYLVKPFSLEELRMRVDAVLRRTRPTVVDDEVLSCAGVVIDQVAHRVRRDDHDIHLTPTEYELLVYLMVNAGRVVSRDQILDRVWNFDVDGRGRVVETYMSSLRRKLAVGGPPVIHTIRGFGYSLRPAD